MEIKYAIYTYRLTEKVRRNDRLGFDPSAIENLTSEEKFELIFPQKQGASLQIQRIKKDGADKYPCTVLRHEEHVIMLLLENEKGVDIWEEQPTQGPIPKIEKKTKRSTPYCYVIIDNRPGIHQIAIQSPSPAWKNPNMVKTLLEESINWISNVLDYGLEVHIRSKMLPTKFWEYVDRKRKKDKVSIKRMVFSFTNYKRRPDIDIMQALSSEWKHMESFMAWMNQIGVDKGEIDITPPKDDSLIKRKYADIKHMVEICMNSNYALSITFSDGITYKCNQELRAELPMKDETIRLEFEQGYKELFSSYRILEWLDEVVNEIKQYQDVEEVKPKPGGKAKRQVS